ncbi:MAG: hypothetical protein R2779_05845 [Crocinitomicaceae bacterium]
MLRVTLIFFAITKLFFANTQTRFEFGYSFGANATTARTIKSNNMTFGYYTPPIPNTWTNHWSLGWGTEKDRVYLAFDSGGLGPTWRAHGYTNKYPLNDASSNSSNNDFSAETHYQGGSRANSNLIKFSLLYKHNWTSNKKLHHKSIIGFGFLKNQNYITSSSSVMSFYNDTLGWVSSGMILDKYEYNRIHNYYFILGYQLTYKIKNRWNINLNIMYNQGLFKMIRWHTYRIYYESLTGYSEFDEQWSFARLSYFAFLIGATYDIGGYKKKNAHFTGQA